MVMKFLVWACLLALAPLPSSLALNSAAGTAYIGLDAPGPGNLVIMSNTGANVSVSNCNAFVVNGVDVLSTITNQEQTIARLQTQLLSSSSACATGNAQLMAMISILNASLQVALSAATDTAAQLSAATARLAAQNQTIAALQAQVLSTNSAAALSIATLNASVVSTTAANSNNNAVSASAAAQLADTTARLVAQNQTVSSLQSQVTTLGTTTASSLAALNSSMQSSISASTASLGSSLASVNSSLTSLVANTQSALSSSLAAANQSWTAAVRDVQASVSSINTTATQALARANSFNASGFTATIANFSSYFDQIESFINSLPNTPASNTNIIKTLAMSLNTTAQLVNGQGNCGATSATIFNSTSGQCIYASSLPLCPNLIPFPSNSGFISPNCSSIGALSGGLRSGAQCTASCSIGYVMAGSPVYTCNNNSQWIGGSLQCILAPCPNNIGTPPLCSCDAYTGFSGDVSFSTTGWSGLCTAVPCPANSTLQGSSCVCDTTFAGNVTWSPATKAWVGSCSRELYNFTAHTFTSCGATGQTPPTLAQCQTAYLASPTAAVWASNSSFYSVSAGIQSWTAPYTGLYSVRIAGGQGGGSPNNGAGRVLLTNVTLTAGARYKILVGQSGVVASANSDTGGGGGGTFFATITNTPLAVAGGGGGSGTNAVSSNGLFSFTQGSTQGGGSSVFTGGGGGFTGDGAAYTFRANTANGMAFINGGAGGAGGPAGVGSYTGGGHGGFGGGGGTCGCSTGGGAGGGGYSGGCGSQCVTAGGTTYYSGTGGTSFYPPSGALDQGLNTGNGFLTITLLCRTGVTC